jgi:hypothetical protein
MATTTTEFDKAIPEQKEKIVITHLHDVSVQLLMLKVDLRRVKGFVNRYPELHKTGNASLYDADTMALNISRMSVQMDDVTRELVDIAIETNKLIQYLLSLQTQNSNE